MAKGKPTAEGLKKPKGEVGIDIPQGAYPTIIYANVVGVESVDGHKLLHFGFIMPPGRLMGAWACVLEGKLVELQKDNWLNYLSEVGFPERSDDSSFRCPPEKLLLGVAFANLAAWARTGEGAELRLYVYSIGDVVEDRRGENRGKVKGQAVGLVRLPLELQRQLIAAMYQDLIA